MRYSRGYLKGNGNCSIGQQKKLDGVGKRLRNCWIMNEKADCIIERMDFACYSDFCRMLCVLRWNL